MLSYRLLTILAVIITLLSACAPAIEAGNPTLEGISQQPQTSATDSTQLPPPASQGDQTLEVDGIFLTPGVLCAGAHALAQARVSAPEGSALAFSWSARYGTLEGEGKTVTYTAPTEPPADGFDTITLDVSDGKDSGKTSLLVKLISPDALNAWQPTGGPEGGFLTSIEINEANPDILYVGGDGGRIYKSTDSGETWTPSKPFLETRIRVEQLFLNQDDPNVLYVSAMKLYKSEDGGETFKIIFEPQTSISNMTMASFDPETLLLGTFDGSVLLSENGGENWRDLGFPIPADSSVQAVGISTSSEFWVGTREWSNRADGQLFHTSDQGAHWTLVDNMDQYPSTDIQSILVDPLDPKAVYVGLMQSYNEGFDGSHPRAALKTTDGGETWNALPMPEIWDNFVKFMGLTHYDRTLYIGMGGTWMYKAPDGGRSFTKLNMLGRNGDFCDLAIDPRNPDVFFIPSQGAGVLKSSDGGKTFELKYKGIQSTSISLLETATKANNGLIYATSAGGEGQFRSMDFGDSWQRITENGITHPWADEIRVNPHQPNQVWYVADVGRVEVSDQRGDTWRTVIEPYSPGFRFGSVYALAVAPSNPHRLYALKNGFGIFSYEDWVELPGQSRFFHHSEVDYSFALAVYPEDQNVIVSGYIPKPFQDFALLQISRDGGETWETQNRVEGSEGITSAAFSPAYPERLYYASVGWQPTIYRSDQIGQAGQKLPEPWDLAKVEGDYIHYIEVIPHPNLPDVVYVSAYPAGVYRSDDAGENWTEVDNGLPIYQVKDPMRQGRHNLTIAPSNPDTLYTGIYGQGVYQSTNGGATWQKTGLADQLEILALSVDPQDARLIYIGTERGVIRSTDGGDTWSAFMKGMPETPVRTLAWGTDRTMFAGTLGYEIYFVGPDGNHWEQMPGFGQFGTFWPIWNDRPLYQYTSLIFHPEKPEEIIFGTFPAGIFISQDGGKTWRESNTNWTWDGVFSLEYHPEEPNILYSGTYNGLNRSLDGGRTWEMWDNGWPGEQWVFSIDFDPRDPNIMYACSKNGENEGRGQPGFFMGSVMKSENGGESWFEIMNGLRKDQEYYKIIVDPNSPDVLYLATQFDGVYISTNAGEHWTQWNEGLTNRIAGTNGNNVTNTMTLSPDGVYLYFASAGSGIFRRGTIQATQVCGCNP